MFKVGWVLYCRSKFDDDRRRELAMEAFNMRAYRSLFFIIGLAGALMLSLPLVTGSSIPGSGEFGTSIVPQTEKPMPKCIDFTGIDQALAELLMLLDGGQVKPVTEGLTNYTRHQSLAIGGDGMTEAGLGFPVDKLNPARTLGSKLENGADLTLKKVLVNREYTRAYFDDPQVFNFAADGRLLYADNATHKVCIIDADGALVAEFGGEGTGPGQFKAPSAIITDNRGRVFVADRQRGDVQVFSNTGEYRGTLAAGLAEPVGLVLFEDFELFVLERHSATVRVFRIDTMLETRWFGGQGTIPGRYIKPSSIAITRMGSLVIADSGNDRVVTVDRRGKVEKIWTDIRYPQFVATDNFNQVYVLADTIRLYTGNGMLVGEWDRALNFDDGTRYYLGNGLYAELRNRLLINDRFFGNVLVYEAG